MARRLFLLIAALALCVPVTNGSTAEVQDDAESDYAVLLARAKLDPAHADFGKLRMAFAKTPAYLPYDRYTAEDKEINAAIDAGNWTRALQIVNSLLEKNYVRIRSHLSALMIYDKQGDAERARFHHAFVNGLFRSIMSSGDGRSAASAFVVINTEEEYDVIGLSGLQPGSQALRHEGGKSFDVMTVTPRKGGEPIQLFFDITLPWSNSPFGKLAPTKK